MQQSVRGGWGKWREIAGFSLMSGMLNKPTHHGGTAGAVELHRTHTFADPSGNTYLVNKPSIKGTQRQHRTGLVNGNANGLGMFNAMQNATYQQQ